MGGTLRRSGAWALGVVLIAGAAGAESFPARYGVTGVAPGDRLNLRAAPSAEAEVLGEIAQDAQGVEVLGLSPDGQWARIGLPEGEAWAALRYLALEPAPERGFAAPLRCAGTEPFWSVTVDADGAGRFESPQDIRDLVPLGTAAGFRGTVYVFDDEGGVRDLTVVRGACSDGMSDRPYGLSALLWDGQGELLEGCCTLLPR